MNKYSPLKIVWFPDKLNSLRNKKVTAPLYVRIKPTNRCNHNCFFCVYNKSYANMHENMIRQDEISREKILEILFDLKKIGVKAITYSGGGEPLIHPNIIEIMNKTLEYNIDLSILTNGQKLNGERAKILSKAKWVRISIDYFDEVGFKTSRGGSSKMFLEIIDNIKKFAKEPHDGDFEVNFIITKENYKGLEKAAKLLKSLGIDNVRFSPVWIKNMTNYHDSIKKEVIQSIKNIKEKFEDNNFKIYSGYHKAAISKIALYRSYTKCPFMQIVPVIGADSNVYNCHNQSYSEEGIIGSIKNQTFSDLWFSEKTSKYFESFNPQEHCQGIQCTADKKNVLLNNMLDASPDNFV